MHRHSYSDEDVTLSARSRSTLEVVRRVAVYLRPYRGMAAANIGCALISLGFSFAFPQLTQTIIDDVTQRPDDRLSGCPPRAWRRRSSCATCSTACAF